MLLKKQIVVQRDTKAKMPCFMSGDQWGTVADEAVLHFDLSPEDWDDMGSPDQITVTIEPGDRLNP